MTIFSDKLQLLWQNAFFNEFFDEFLNHINSHTDIIERKVYFKKSFEYLCSDAIFEQLLTHKCSLDFAHALANFMKNHDIFEQLSFQPQNFIKSQHASVYFSLFTLQENFPLAMFYLKFADNNLSTYQKTIQKIIDAELIDALDFMCSNLNNIHYDKFKLLELTQNSPNLLILLITKHDFDINAKQNKSNLSFFQEILFFKKTKALTAIFENAIEFIDFNAKLNITINDSLIKFAYEKNIEELSIIDLIEYNDLEKKLFPLILKYEDLNLKTFTQIGNILFSPKKINKFEEIDIYDDFFKHPQFDPQQFNLSQRYFLFGFYALLGDIVNHYKTYIQSPSLALNKINEATLPFKSILKSYFKYHSDKDIGVSPDFHIVGAAVYITRAAQCSNLLDLLSTLISNLPEYVNTPNPNGYYCLDMVSKNSTIYTILKEHGAVDRPKEHSSFKKFIMNNIFKIKTNSPISPSIIKEATQHTHLQKDIKQTSTFNIHKIRLKMRSDLKEMRSYIATPECDPIIKIECENMFLKAEKIAQYIEKNKLTTCYDEFHFLNENFSTYLKASLHSYITVAKNKNEFIGIGDFTKLEKKLYEAHEICMKHIKLLTEQTQLIANNLLLDSNESNLNNLHARTYFLHEKFKETTELLESTKKTSSTINILENLDTQEKSQDLDLLEVNDLLSVSKEQENIIHAIETNKDTKTITNTDKSSDIIDIKNSANQDI